MVKVRVQHPPEASVKVHQVMKVSGFFPALQALSSATQSGSAGAPAPAGLVVQAQTTRGDGVFTQHSGFKYCFREVKDGQCSSPLPGLRSKETCCRGLGKAWGATDCVLCPKHAAGPNSSCPVGFQRGNGTNCVDVNECLQPGLCENGVCVNTRGSYSCVCKPGFILDASHGLCISQTVIAEDKNQCYRVLGSGLGPSSCSLPILRNITKQICCCSRVGKAWGPDCQRCPYFGSVAFKEICPAGPGYHYSPSALQFSQRAAEQLGTQGAQLVTHLDQGETTSSQPKPPARETVSSSNRPSSPVSTPSSRHVNPVNTNRHKPQTPGSAGVRPTRPRPTVSSRRSPQQSSGGQGTSGSQNQGTGRSQTSNQNQESSGNRNTSRNPSPSGGQITSRNQGTNQNQGTSRIQGPNVNPVSTQNQGTSGNRNTGQTQGTNRNHSPSGGQGTSRNQGTNQNQGTSRDQSPSGGQDTSRNQGISKDQSPSGGQGTSRNQGTNQNQGISKDQSPSGGQGTTRNQGTNQNQGTSKDQSPSGGQGTTRIQGVSGSEDRPTGRGDSLPASPQRTPDSRTGGQSPPPKKPTTRPPRVQSSQDVCASKPGVCGGGRCVSQPGGKHTCVCDQGYQANSERTHCQDVNECVQPGGVCSPGECVNTAGSFRCVCRHGYKLSGNACTDVDECEDPLLCPGQQCVNTPGSYRCVSCQPGHGLLNGLCTDIDECRQAPCANGRCENTPGSFRCVCRHGYKLKNNTCTDVDECAEPSQCPGQVCVNSVGSYRCVSCQTGYTLTNRQCTDVNECKDEALCPGGQCVNTEGSYKCVDCRQGYHAVNRVCEDIDECASASACEAERTCVNTLGSFRCDCLPGYRTFGRGRQCRDINECLEENWCPPTGECVNTAGSYTCVCPQGLALGSDNNNRTACVDVNECERSRACADGDCVNTDGSFLCRCHDGFTNNPERNTCLDVDECVSSGGSVCGALRCENTIGSYRCLTSCDPGFQVSSAGQCEDVDECVNRTVCGDHAVCQNVVGTYVCLCDQGFTSTSDGKFCVDEDECVSMPGVCGSARCDNMEGSFMCECDTPGEEFDTASRRCVSTPPSPPQRGTFPIGSSSPSSSTFHAGVFDLAPVLPRLPAAGPGELRECYYNLGDGGSCSLLAANTSQQECCCTLGEGWGLGCQYHACPLIGTADFLSLCPSGRGYVSTGAGAFSYTDVDECKRFHPEVCKSGVCVNNIPGYNCYCSSGFVYSSTLLECVDLDECEQETCVGGQCVNTIGSYYCSCPPPLVLDDTQRNCVNSSHLNLDENLSVCWQTVSADFMCQSPLLGAQVTFTDCCCLYGDGWGMECALCPATDSDDFASLCSSFAPPVFPQHFPDSTGPETPERGRVGAPLFFPPFSSDTFPPSTDYGGPEDYEDYSPGGGGRPQASLSLPGAVYRGEPFDGYYTDPGGSPFRPSDPRPGTPPLGPAPRPGAYEEEEEDSWGPGPPFPPFGGDRSRGGGALRRVYERRYDSYAGLSAAEDCGFLHDCQNGSCIRVDEGYTCDCYHGYQLDMTTMTCTDVNECEDGAGVDFPCVNSRCVNTDGSFRCVCRRGYVMSRRPNHCVAA